MTSNSSPPHRTHHRAFVLCLALLLAPSALLAQEAAEAEQKEEPAPSPSFLKIGGYAETYYSWNFAKPENGITNNRWLDEKHNTFTLATVGLDVTAQKGPFYGRLSLMFGPTADRWYFEGVRTSEEGVALSPAGYHNETWKHLQIAYVGYTAPIGDGLTVYAGLFPTQVGYEGAAVKDNWNWSRSNLFNFLPFFHVGARVAYPLTKTFTLTGAVYNGYNQMTDLNGKKTLSLHGSLVLDKFFLNIMYMGGDETVKKDGRAPWRNMIDLVAQYDVHPRLSLALHGDTGFEKGDHMW
ncbi:MAG TPA: outer membrane beta-barrel protein, partial [Polyangiales bacterium]|nr:outer membrane beta-barrel protein [Polyangiales bacterium]